MARCTRLELYDFPDASALRRGSSDSDRRWMKFGERAFGYVGPAAWNSLPAGAVFVGGKPGNFPLTGYDLPSHWFV